MVIDRRGFMFGAGTTALLAARTARAAPPTWRIPITVTDTRILVDCTIGPNGPYRFVFDTGGTIGLIDLALAKQLKLAQIGTSKLGLKQGPGLYPIFRVPDFSFGGQVRQPESVIAGQEVIDFARDGAVGSLAAGSLTAADAELDFDANEWRIYRDGPPDRAGWTRYDKAIVHAGNMNGSAFLYADATLAGKPFRFGLDTGQPSMMRIYRKAAIAAGLWDAPRWSPAAPDGKGRVVRAPLALAGETMPGVVITMTEDPNWTIFPHGLIGLPVLRRFNMATAAKESALYLRRNAQPARPERYNRAGLWVDRDRGGVRVGVVGPGSPAEKAGLKPGDRLTGIDFGSLIQGMMGPAGSTIPLVVESGGARRALDLVLEDFL